MCRAIIICFIKAVITDVFGHCKLNVGILGCGGHVSKLLNIKKILCNLWSIGNHYDYYDHFRPEGNSVLGSFIAG